MLIGLITERPDSQFHKCHVIAKDGKPRDVIDNVVRVYVFYVN